MNFRMNFSVSATKKKIHWDFDRDYIHLLIDLTSMDVRQMAFHQESLRKAIILDQWHRFEINIHKATKAYLPNQPRLTLSSVEEQI